MNTAQRLSLALLVTPLALAIQATSAHAKVSAEEMLCFQPGQTSMHQQNERTLLRLRDKARQLGRLEGTFVTTVVSSPALEEEHMVQNRGLLVLARLGELGLRHSQSLADRFLTESLESQGCPKGQVPVQVTLLFAEPTYLKVPPPK
jgi:hypothetical protein